MPLPLKIAGLGRYLPERVVPSAEVEALCGRVAEAGLALSDIDLILNASGTPEQAIPDGGPLVQRQLGLGSSGIACLSVHGTCLSFLAALDLAANLLAMQRYQR